MAEARREVQSECGRADAITVGNVLTSQDIVGPSTHSHSAGDSLTQQPRHSYRTFVSHRVVSHKPKFFYPVYLSSGEKSQLVRNEVIGPSDIQASS